MKTNIVIKETHDMHICDKIVRGIGLILVAKNTGRVYTVRELEAKPIIHKEAGMISFPLETIKPPETCRETIRRLVEEEISGCSHESIANLSISPEFVMIVPGVHAHIAWGYCEKEFCAKPQDDDVAYHGWCTISELLSEKSFVRVETRPLLGIYLNVCR